MLVSGNMGILKDQKGLTLVELVIAVAIIGILSGFAYQMLGGARSNMRLRSAARDIYSTMMQAKVEAIKRGENVTILFVPAAASYSMFLDNGAGGGTANDEVVDPGESVLLVSDPGLSSRVTFAATPPVAAADGVSFANNALVFNSRGIPVNASTGGLGMGGIGIRPIGEPTYWRAVTVSSAGRIAMQ